MCPLSFPVSCPVSRVLPIKSGPAGGYPPHRSTKLFSRLCFLLRFVTRRRLSTAPEHQAFLLFVVLVKISDPPEDKAFLLFCSLLRFVDPQDAIHHTGAPSVLQIVV